MGCHAVDVSHLQGGLRGGYGVASVIDLPVDGCEFRGFTDVLDYRTEAHIHGFCIGGFERAPGSRIGGVPVASVFVSQRGDRYRHLHDQNHPSPELASTPGDTDFGVSIQEVGEIEADNSRCRCGR